MRHVSVYLTWEIEGGPLCVEYGVRQGERE